MANLLVDEEVLSPDQEEALEMILQKFKGKPGSLIQAFTCCPELDWLSASPGFEKSFPYFRYSSSEVYGVVTFITFFPLNLEENT